MSNQIKVVNAFGYRVMVRIPNADWKVFDDVLDEVNACAIANEAIECITLNGKSIIEARVIEKETRKCIYEASK